MRKKHQYAWFGFLIILRMSLFFLPKSAFCSLLKLDFSQDNRTYIWNTRLDCDRQVEQGLSWGFSSSINSMLIKKSIFSNNQNRWQEDGSINLNLDYPLASRFKLGALLSQQVNSLEKRKVTSSEYGITSEYNVSGFKFFQIMGIKNVDRKLEGGKRKDAGFNHQLEISHSAFILPNFTSRISFSQISSRLSNVPLLQRDFNIFFAKNFSLQDSLEFNYQEGWSKNKFYLGDLTDSTIGTQRRTQRVVNLRSSTQIPLQIRVDFDFDFTLNRYKYTGGQERQLPGLTNNLSNSQNFSLSAKRGFFQRFTLRSYYKYLQTKEDYADDQKDQEMKNAELGGNATIQISEADSLYLSTSIGVTSFYAPKISAGFNDRDLLTVFAWGEYLHDFVSFFSLRIEAGFKNFHQVYISDRLSANNNHNQTYVLSPTLIWRPNPALEFMQNYNIQANYIYYDYEKSKESTKNRLFRRASLSNNLSYSLTHQVKCALGYIYRYEDYGQLIWKDQWVQKPSWERRTHTFSFHVEYRPTRSVVFSPEYTYKIRKSWDHFTDLVTLKKSRALSDKFSENLLSLACRYFMGEQNYINLSLAERVQKDVPGSKDISNYATVSVGWVF